MEHPREASRAVARALTARSTTDTTPSSPVIKKEDTAVDLTRSSSTKKSKKKKKSHKGGPDNDMPLFAQVKTLEESENRLRYEKKKLGKVLDKTETALKEERVKNNRLQNTNNALQKTRDELFSELQVVKKKLETEAARAEKLDGEVKVHEFDSRKFRTALSAAFKLLTALGDQVTLKTLVKRTDYYLRRKIARLGGSAPASTTANDHITDELDDDDDMGMISDVDDDLFEEPDGVAVASQIQAANEHHNRSEVDLKHESDSDDEKPWAMTRSPASGSVKHPVSTVSDSDSEDKPMMKLRASTVAAREQPQTSPSSGGMKRACSTPPASKRLLDESIWDEDSSSALSPAKRLKREAGIDLQPRHTPTDKAGRARLGPVQSWRERLFGLHD
ncbi:ezrin/radixin/moesin family domain-containing protein [Purpureocillium lavendulum]|uniref:Ezrin/radixin/moesin family domain-containing protein n=1 Tax=Purpureocillium lavendulum TaxID=1247861 RepID=A0AB34FLD7_9HYPO|nr:ezrin/radixin/moesin family domain-containing protein [Purpureocillium lavendulum]